MIKKLLVLMILSGLIVNASTIDVNGVTKVVVDKKYYFLCIFNYKWIQFVELGGGVGRDNIYVPSGNPQQLFERYNDVSVPVRCN